MNTRIILILLVVWTSLSWSKSKNSSLDSKESQQSDLICLNELPKSIQKTWDEKYQRLSIIFDKKKYLVYPFQDTIIRGNLGYHLNMGAKKNALGICILSTAWQKIKENEFLNSTKKTDLLSDKKSDKNTQNTSKNEILDKNKTKPHQEISKSSKSDNNISMELPKQFEDKSPNTKNTKNSKKPIIILDAGHGGHDAGAAGVDFHEKDIALKVVKKLAQVLKDHDFEVHLTRDKDEFIELQDRPKIANDLKGDLFVSVHLNSVDQNVKNRTKTHGYTFYILREAESEDDKNIANRENQIAQAEAKKSLKELSAYEKMMVENQIVMYSKESIRLTTLLLDSFEKNKKVSKHGSGAGQAGFRVLMGAQMPAVLAEIGFVSNPNEEEYLASENGSNEIAQNLFNAISKWSKDL